jgi:hypothetical protein
MFSIFRLNVTFKRILTLKCSIPKKGIHTLLRQKEVKKRFKQEILGYHMINSNPVKESVWEDINANIVSDHCVITEQALGNHLSGIDMKFNNWRISNKTAKISGNRIRLSSYRLTSVCNNRNIGCKDDIVDEIERRDGTFDYYSLLLRSESNNILTYNWYVVPNDILIFDAGAHGWEYKLKKDDGTTVTGWKSKYMDITFSMSSQLWYRFDESDIEDYKILDVEVDLYNETQLRYSDIYKLLNQEI